MNNCVYIFLDEAGDANLGYKGSRFFVLTSVSMHRPFSIRDAIDDYKHHCLERGRKMEYFHCCDDRKRIRTHLFNLIGSHSNNIRINYLVVERSVAISKYGIVMDKNTYFYPKMMGHLLKSVIPVELENGAQKVIILTDTLPVRTQRKAVEKSARTTLAKILPVGMKYQLWHHRSRSHYGLQMADYCCWAVFQKWERGNNVWYDLIKQAICIELKIP